MFVYIINELKVSIVDLYVFRKLSNVNNMTVNIVYNYHELTSQTVGVYILSQSLITLTYSAYSCRRAH